MVKYKVYYFDNDAQKIIVAENLSYWQAIKFEQKWYGYFNSQLNHEMQ